ncbi:MAG: hypothetical protein WC988_03545 [Patescibacteria group bacterium]
MATQISYSQTLEFEKGFRKLLKRFGTLKDDLETAKIAAIELYHIHKIDNLSIFPVQGFCVKGTQIFKLKKFACRALKGRGSKSGIRIIYAFYSRENKIEFIEIYFKGDQENYLAERSDTYYLTALKALTRPADQ